MLINFDLLPEGTSVFDQFPGVTFPGKPRIIRPADRPVHGVQALSNSRPGDELDSRPLTVEFSSAQTWVNLVVGSVEKGDGEIRARLRAFNSAGHVVAEDETFPFSIPRRVEIGMRVEPTIPLHSPLLAAAWAAAQKKFEDTFTGKFKDSFITRLTEEIRHGIMEEDPHLVFFLRDACITSDELALGFCIPIEEILDPAHP